VTRTIVLLAALLLPAPLVGQTVLVVITGIGGEDRYDERFHTWAATLMDAATDRYGLPDSNVVYLAADPERDPARATARSTKENIQTTLSRLAGTTPEGDLVFIVVIGHGSYRNGISKINLPGPDMTATEFAVALDAFGDRPIVFANLSSASGESSSRRCRHPTARSSRQPRAEWNETSLCSASSSWPPSLAMKQTPTTTSACPYWKPSSTLARKSPARTMKIKSY
jgi:hypothetical protein